ncbi:unnamed protein product [Dracunculus medinensis]|uniref:Nucleoside-diphosphatase mig-23 n=1 Tax=Dracunculus medinensis TaxID=318479 RepID=A0A0N4UGR1_DRAME|nr:unnamed protein product [Dracunculus medinensis]
MQLILCLLLYPSVTLLFAVFIELLISLCDEFLTNTNREISNERIRSDATVEIKPCLSSRLAMEKDGSRFFAVVIDAGSTGTRIHIFEFSHGISENASHFYIKNGTMKEIKPGLSSYAAKPEDAIDGIKILLNLARNTIPQNLWKYTPITLKATAGLRLLQDHQANALLNQVKTFIVGSGFFYGDDSIGIISGTDEGIFSWFTINMLSGQMGNFKETSEDDCENSVYKSSMTGKNQFSAATLDLGGGSTQITFLPTDLYETFVNVDRELFSHKLDIFGNLLNLYTHSYLGNGLVASRLGTIQRSPLSTKNLLVTSCLPEKLLVKDRDYTGLHWSIKGSSSYSFKNCLLSVMEYISFTEVKKAYELNKHKIYVTGYFYDRGMEAKLAVESINGSGGISSVDGFKKAAVEACSRTTREIARSYWRPWECFDLTYIYGLLKYGYGLDDKKEIHLVKRLKGIETSWALDASYHLLHSYHQNIFSSRESLENMNAFVFLSSWEAG